MSVKSNDQASVVPEQVTNMQVTKNAPSEAIEGEVVGAGKSFDSLSVEDRVKIRLANRDVPAHISILEDVPLAKVLEMKEKLYPPKQEA
jgi:hypothetical protein